MYISHACRASCKADNRAVRDLFVWLLLVCLLPVERTNELQGQTEKTKLEYMVPDMATAGYWYWTWYWPGSRASTGTVCRTVCTGLGPGPTGPKEY